MSALELPGSGDKTASPTVAERARVMMVVLAGGASPPTPPDLSVRAEFKGSPGERPEEVGDAVEGGRTRGWASVGAGCKKGLDRLVCEGWPWVLLIVALVMLL